jgi:hypothetical protein
MNVVLYVLCRVSVNFTRTVVQDVCIGCVCYCALSVVPYVVYSRNVSVLGVCSKLLY